MSSSDQNLLPGESYLNYRGRVIDTKSPTFCGAKWYYATIWLNSGMTTSCHHPLPHFVSEEEVRKNYKALSNTPKKKQERQEMKDGIRCNGCDYCWRIEDLGPDHVSDRVYKSVLYTDQLLEKAYNSDTNEDFDLRYLEISFDRTCNLACSYCNPAFSSSWAKDIKTKGPYIKLSQDGHNHFGHAHDSSGRYDDNDDNPYVQAFFKWWQADLHKTLTHLRLTGGEPLMSQHTWTLLDWFSTNSVNQDLYFAVNSNLMAKDSLIDKLLKSTRNLKNFHIYTSCENFGSRANYLRDGFEWNKWESNVKKVLSSEVPMGVHSMCTVNAASVIALPEYLDWCVNIKKEFGHERFYFTLNILRFPVFQNILTLPDYIRKETAERLHVWLDHQDRSILSEMEIGHVERLIDYLNNSNNIRSINELPALRNEFREFYTQYDQRRGKDFGTTFPELKEWYDSIQV
jgi:organic radical activating enzyme